MCKHTDTASGYLKLPLRTLEQARADIAKSRGRGK